VRVRLLEEGVNEIPDQVFNLHGSWQAIVGGHIVGADWPDKGSALAGMQVEQRRQAARAAKASAPTQERRHG